MASLLQRHHGRAIRVLIPKSRFWAALQIAAAMPGATVTNLFIPAHARFGWIYRAALALALGWLRRPQLV